MKLLVYIGVPSYSVDALDYCFCKVFFALRLPEISHKMNIFEITQLNLFWSLCNQIEVLHKYGCIQSRCAVYIFVSIYENANTDRLPENVQHAKC